MREVRIRFSKTGKAKFISHLDLTRCFARAMARAEIPLWYTEGFNPRPYMIFTSPLTLGAESQAEALDIRLLDETMSDEEVARRLGAVMPPDIRVISASAPVYKLNQIVESRYRVEVEPSDRTPEALAEAFSEVSQQDELLVEKSGKKGKRKVMKTVDLKPHIKDLSIAVEGERVVLSVTLPSSSQFGVNPRLFLDKFLSETGEEPVRIRMIREAMYVADNILFE